MRSRYPFHSLIVYAEMNEPKRSSDLPCRESVIAFVVVLRKRERRGRQRLVPMPICETLSLSLRLYTLLVLRVNPALSKAFYNKTKSVIKQNI